MIWLHLDRDWCVWERHVPVYCLHEGESVRVRFWGDTYFSTVLTLRNGALDHPECWVKWGDHYRVQLPDRQMHVLWQETLPMIGLTVTVVKEAGVTMWIEGQTDSTMLPLGAECADWKTVDLPALSAVAIEGRVGDRRLLVVADVYTSKALYQGVVDEWRQQEMSIEVVCTHMDMKRHVSTARMGYQEGNWCTLEHRVICTDEHTYIPRLIPYLFAEALAVGALDEARSYLTDALALEFEPLLSYIGRVDEVAIPPIDMPNTVGVVQNGVGKTLLCTLAGDKIDDVEWTE